MSAPAATSPEATVTALLRALDSFDTDAVEALFSDDVQGIDELSQGWRRGREAVHAYLEMVKGAGLSNVHSAMSDVHNTEWGETALVTFVLDQSYDLAGRSYTIHAPTSVVMRREDGAWRVCLVHSVPLPDSEPA